MQQAQQLFLFDNPSAALRPVRHKRTGGSQNPIVFHDYESFVAKFQDKEKTTDDTYTPKDVYEAVLQYVGEVYDLSGKGYQSATLPPLPKSSEAVLNPKAWNTRLIVGRVIMLLPFSNLEIWDFFTPTFSLTLPA